MTAAHIRSVSVPVTVVGLQQHLYAVGDRIVSLDEAVHAAELDDLDAVRELLLKTERVLKTRTERLAELNRAFALMAKIRADTSNLDMKTSYSSPDVLAVLEIAKRLGVPLEMSPKTNRGEVTKAYAQLQHEVNNETNRIQQAVSPLNNCIHLHDRRFMRLDGLLKKIVGTPSGTVRNLG